MDVSLSKEQVDALVGTKLPVVSLTNDKSIRKLYQAIRRRGDRRFLVHYQTKHFKGGKQGHWCGLQIRGNELWFFDSYGEFPDDQLESINWDYRKATGQEDRKLGEFLYKCAKAGYRIRYNEYAYQKKENGINTCGRWVAFWMDSGLSPEKFHTYVEGLMKRMNRRWGKMSPDQMVVAVTQNSLI